MRTRDRLRLLEKAARDFQSVAPIITSQKELACSVWYRPDNKSANAPGVVIGAGSDKIYLNTQRYLVAWDMQTQMPSSEAIDSSIRYDAVRRTQVEGTVMEVLDFIRKKGVAA